MAPTKAQLVLNAVVTLKVHFQMDEAPKQRVQTMTAIKAATFAPLISRMVGNGLLEYGLTPGTLIITSKGETKAEPMEVATTNKQVQEEIKKKLKGKALRIFEYLADGGAHEKVDIMQAVDCKNPKTFSPLVSRELKKHGYVEYPSRSTIQLANMCFPFGRDKE